METGLVAHLLAAGTACGSRIYPLTAPQRTADQADSAVYPYLVYRIAGDEGATHMAGASDLWHARIILEIFARKYTDARDVFLSLIQQSPAILHGFSGTMGTITVRQCFVTNRIDRYVPPKDGTEKGVYSVEVTADAWYRQP